MFSFAVFEHLNKTKTTIPQKHSPKRRMRGIVAEVSMLIQEYGGTCGF